MNILSFVAENELVCDMFIIVIFDEHGFGFVVKGIALKRKEGERERERENCK
jgi:hypothetical protein